MAVVQSDPVRRRDAHTEELTVVATTELRWFVPGPLPADVRCWFSGSTGVSEDRCDTYLLDGRRNIGVKLRFRETLERKVRHSLGGRIEAVRPPHRSSDGLPGVACADRRQRRRGPVRAADGDRGAIRRCRSRNR